MTEISIRPASLDDAEGIAGVQVKSWQTTYDGILEKDYLESLEVQSRIQMWREIVQQEHAVTYVAVEKGYIVGFCNGGPERTKAYAAEGEIYAIYLLKSAQQHGLGSKLMAAVAKQLYDRGMSSLLVWVLADNPSRAFYEKLGAVKVDEEKVDIGGTKCLEVAYVWNDIATIIA
ncbi:acetyltransferase [Pullulanibacillus camelliae]|uniref:Acetyltransferase n=1 Tax=Pullulanibacillus camelliae TaxID=1707096 RepID=A0A8J2YHX1_9BACL|nr:GNAT family N-acetyltransferase [Pullulanibacillus camelliae]GGE44064.1 acetyltransferase [Pullulanibacillus camelliae]